MMVGQTLTPPERSAKPKGAGGARGHRSDTASPNPFGMGLK